MTASRRGTANPQNRKPRRNPEPLEGRDSSPISRNARRLEAFRRQLLAWYDANKRDLPWRVTKDAYGIWISEIMLQQTRVAVVQDYYPPFLKQFPTVAALARARLSSVLAAWSGLGYYRRARALHAAARMLVQGHGGGFPRTVEELRELPGIGKYTASAIASIAFGEPAAVVDGNVERVITRLLGRKSDTSGLWKHAGELLEPARPGDFNQAMMELGAMVCLPRQPLCPACPVHGWCATRGDFGERVVERRKKANLRYCLAASNGSVFLVRRPANASLMAGMWELPQMQMEAPVGENGVKLRHSITVTDYSVEVISGKPPAGSPGRWVSVSRVTALPLTGLTRKIFRRAGII